MQGNRVAFDLDSPYTLIVLPRARSTLEALELPEQDRVLRVLETELQAREPSAETLQSRGTTYRRTRVGARLDAVYRSLDQDELRDVAAPAYVVYALVPSGQEPVA